jgi:hypothetical protein
MKRKLKALVRPEGVSSEILLAIWIAEQVYEEKGASQFCITSLTDGKHMVGSRHYCGKAVDLRIWTLPVDKRKDAAKLIQHRLGAAYFVLLETDHLHIQYNGL